MGWISSSYSPCLCLWCTLSLRSPTTPPSVWSQWRSPPTSSSCARTMLLQNRALRVDLRNLCESIENHNWMSSELFLEMVDPDLMYPNQHEGAQNRGEIKTESVPAKVRFGGRAGCWDKIVWTCFCFQIFFFRFYQAERWSVNIILFQQCRPLFLSSVFLFPFCLWLELADRFSFFLFYIIPGVRTICK